jgi:hypothetical protein
LILYAAIIGRETGFRVVLLAALALRYLARSVGA